MIRTLVRRLRHKLDDDASSPMYIFAERRASRRLPDAERTGERVNEREGRPAGRARVRRGQQPTRRHRAKIAKHSGFAERPKLSRGAVVGQTEILAFLGMKIAKEG